jgi:broad specificity phosphatase PhoE
MRVKILLIRHSLSCSNLVRHHAEALRHRKCKTIPTCDKSCAYSTALEDQSQKIRDPGLTALGRKMADTYGASLRKKASEQGFDLSAATIGSSSLRRAKETAALLFPEATERLVVFPHLSEHGKIPENTPKEHRLTKPGWNHFLRHIYRRFKDTAAAASDDPIQIIAVSHGSYMKDVWWELTSCYVGFNNLDSFFFEGELDSRGKLVAKSPLYILYDGIPPTPIRKNKDSCPLAPLSATRKRRRVSRNRKTHRNSQR